MRLSYFLVIFFSEDSSSHLASSSSILNHVPSLVAYFYNISLDKLPTLEEIKDAVFSLGRDCALGPDGFSGSFFTHCWVLLLRMSLSYL